MSNRTEHEINTEAELRVSHLKQIDILLSDTLSDVEKVEAFGEEVGAGPLDVAVPAAWVRVEYLSPAKSVWEWSFYQKSLFADMPHCRCPVLEVAFGRLHDPDIPKDIPNNWRPTRQTLEAFSRIQIERRFPKEGRS